MRAPWKPPTLRCPLLPHGVHAASALTDVVLHLQSIGYGPFHTDPTCPAGWGSTLQPASLGYLCTRSLQATAQPGLLGRGSSGPCPRCTAPLLLVRAFLLADDQPAGTAAEWASVLCPAGHHDASDTCPTCSLLTTVGAYVSGLGSSATVGRLPDGRVRLQGPALCDSALDSVACAYLIDTSRTTQASSEQWQWASWLACRGGPSPVLFLANRWQWATPPPVVLASAVLQPAQT